MRLLYIIVGILLPAVKPGTEGHQANQHDRFPPAAVAAAPEIKPLDQPDLSDRRGLPGGVGGGIVMGMRP